MYNRSNNAPLGNYNNHSSRSIAIPPRRYSNRLSIGGNADPYPNRDSNTIYSAGIQQHMYPRQSSMAHSGFYNSFLHSSYSSLSYVNENAVPAPVQNNSASSEEASTDEWENNRHNDPYANESHEYNTYGDSSYGSSFDPYSPQKQRAWDGRTSHSHDTYRRANINPFEYKNECARKNYAYNQIEVAPNEFMRLRGADETLDAIENDFFVPSDCIICQQTILCIQDADFVLCPLCKTVGPVDLSENPSSRYDCSVGLGFTPSDLARWTSGDGTDSKQADQRVSMLRMR